MSLCKEAMLFSVKKAICYKANLISWILADLALYGSTIMGYYIITSAVTTIGGYNRGELLFYVSTYYLINNLFAVFFSDGLDIYSQLILDGEFPYVLLNPRGVLLTIIMKNINFAPLLSTPAILAFHLYCMWSLNLIVTPMYLLSVLAGIVTMLFVYLILSTLELFGVRAEALSPIMVQMLELAERPDGIFQKNIRDLFIYIIPVFLLSAVPVRIILGKALIIEKVWCIVGPLVLFCVFRLIFACGLKKYEIGAE